MNRKFSFVRDFQKETVKPPCAERFNVGPQMSVEHIYLLYLFPGQNPILDRKLYCVYSDCSNLYLLTGRIFSTVNLNTEGQ